MAILSIVEQAYRAPLDEQDDTTLWINHMIRNAGASLSLLLRGNAVNYAVKGQSAEGLTIGGVPFSHPPRLDHDLQALMDARGSVHAVEEDLANLGMQREELLGDVTLVPQRGGARLFDAHDHIWHW